jgi:tagaturonate reductase
MLKELNRQSVSSTHERPIKILQFGEGNFLRAFADWMVDVMNEKTDFNGAVLVVQPLAQGMSDMLNKQDGLYHVVLNGIRHGQSFSETRLITSVVGAINPYEQYTSFLKAAENPQLEFVISNTTEAGITFDATDNLENNIPKTFPGKLAALLHHRFQYFGGDGTKALTIIPCELIDKNGFELKRAILQYIELWQLSKDFRKWIEVHTAFCNTLVDRIVPGFPKDTINEIQQKTGYNDNLVVMAEPFHLWVIEGPAEVQKRFPADQAGLDVKFVTDQTPYRTRKVRILNGAHTALVPVAYLHGLRTVREAVENELTGGFIKKAIFEEIIPTLDLPPEELKQFAHDVMERFQNPYIRHELASIALNSVSKFKVRVLPSIIEYVNRTGKLPHRLLYSLASLIRFYKGTWRGEPLPVNDTEDVIHTFREAWKQSTPESTALYILKAGSLWDRDLSSINGLAPAVVKYLAEINAIENAQKSLTIDGSRPSSLP